MALYRDLARSAEGEHPADMAVMAERDPAAFELLARTRPGDGPVTAGAGDDDPYLTAVGSPLKAAGFSFVSFAGGAALPVVPFAVASGTAALVAAAVIAALALFAVYSAPLALCGTSFADHSPGERPLLR